MRWDHPGLRKMSSNCGTMKLTRPDCNATKEGEEEGGGGEVQTAGNGGSFLNQNVKNHIDNRWVGGRDLCWPVWRQKPTNDAIHMKICDDSTVADCCVSVGKSLLPTAVQGLGCVPANHLQCPSLINQSWHFIYFHGLILCMIHVIQTQRLSSAAEFWLVTECPCHLEKFCWTQSMELQFSSLQGEIKDSLNVLVCG